MQIQTCFCTKATNRPQTDQIITECYKTGFMLTTYLSNLGEKPDFMIDLEGSNFSVETQVERVRVNKRDKMRLMKKATQTKKSNIYG